VRLVVKGGGHSYQGTSNAADSLMVWTRRMNAITLHDAFIAQGCAAAGAPVRAVSVGAGAIWAHVYDAVTTKAGGYVQGGGCMTVGVAGLIQSGGFGSFSKRYGLAAASLLEAEVVTADGEVRIANTCSHPDLFWALKGGGGRQLRRRHARHLARASAAGRFRCGEHDHQGRVAGGVSQARRPDRRLLRRAPGRPALGRADPLFPERRAGHRDGVPGPDARPGARGVAAVHGRGRGRG
jgi:hypothetical protein